MRVCGCGRELSLSKCVSNPMFNPHIALSADSKSSFHYENIAQDGNVHSRHTDAGCLRVSVPTGFIFSCLYVFLFHFIS